MRFRNKPFNKALSDVCRMGNMEFVIVEQSIILKPTFEKNKPEGVLNTSNKYTLSGSIVDAVSGESLIGATVYCREMSSGAAANSYGFYSLTLNGGKYTLRYSFVGYQGSRDYLRFKFR